MEQVQPLCCNHFDYYNRSIPINESSFLLIGNRSSLLLPPQSSPPSRYAVHYRQVERKGNFEINSPNPFSIPFNSDFRVASGWDGWQRMKRRRQCSRAGTNRFIRFFYSKTTCGWVWSQFANKICLFAKVLPCEGEIFSFPERIER